MVNDFVAVVADNEVLHHQAEICRTNDQEIGVLLAAWLASWRIVLHRLLLTRC